MRLLLDTAVFILAVESPERLSRRGAVIFRNPEHDLELSAVSLSEIAIKAALGKLPFSALQTRQALEDLNVHMLPYTAEHAFRLFDLPLHHTDPFDRQIIAQALCEDIPVVTCDEKFRMYKGLRVIW
jgi:PIN domain nuclease of toxin-antitoxin system